ncbi:MAG: hypothetical protein IPK74_05435 [Deltaproteobacteria bacterium]|nr:hypothetical protein [Deltaproteobacteria bacterium]
MWRRRDRACITTVARDFGCGVTGRELASGGVAAHVRRGGVARDAGGCARAEL